MFVSPVGRAGSHSNESSYSENASCLEVISSFPRKSYTAPVYDKMPWYYVAQII